MATFKQERHVELVPGAAEAFVITNEVTAATIPDQLPHLNVFVIAVASPLDPKQDTLARVATIADLSLVPIGRDAGIAAPGADGTVFLAQACTVRYSTLETANDAAVTFQDRVNALIEDWITFRTEFNAPDPTPASYTFPRTDATQKEALINAYATAKQARYQAQLDKNAADATVTVAQTDYTYKQGLIAPAGVLVTDATRVQGDVSTLSTNFSTLRTAGSTFYAANTGGTGAAAFAAALAIAIAQEAAATTYATDAATNVTDATTAQTNRTSEAAAASAALTTAQANQITKAQTLTSALATESAALAAVLAVCPDFDKHSIPFVPDTEP